MSKDNSRFLSPEDNQEDNQHIESLVSPENLNVAITMADDGNTCILCDYNFERPPKFIALDESTSTVFLAGGDFGRPGIPLQYPVEHDKISIWKDKKVTYFAHVNNDGAENIYEVDIEFLNT